MSDFWLYFTLGLEHVLDWNAYDHVLFIVALCASYSLQLWKRLLLLVSVFTIGHTTSLYLASIGWFPMSSEVVELLIPISIILTALYNIWVGYREKSMGNAIVLYVVTLLFGIIHGFGFGRYYTQINDEGTLTPLVSFALGIEASQVIVVLGVLLIGHVFNKLITLSKKWGVIIVSILVILATLFMLFG